MSRQSNPSNKQLWPAAIVCVLLGASIIFAMFTPSSQLPTGAQNTAIVDSGVNNVVRIGQLLYSPSAYSYVLPFEIASLVLLVAIVGAIAISRED